MKKLAARARRGCNGRRSKVTLTKRKFLRSCQNQKEKGKSRGKEDRTERNISRIKAATVHSDDLLSNHSDNGDESSYQTAVEEEEDCANVIKTSIGKKTHDGDDDDDYVPSNSESSDVDDDEVSLDDDDYFKRATTSSKRQRETKTAADHGSTGSEEISWNEHSMDDEDLSFCSDGSIPQKDRTVIRATRKTNSNSSYNSDDDEDISNVFSMDETDEDANEDGSHNLTGSNASCNLGGDEEFSNIFSMDETDEDTDEDVSPSKQECCRNKVDAITICPLEPIHVCWISPDGENRQCYNLDTLRKVSISRDKDVLLEPPHFRCDISGKLQEQIVSKFGRVGLLVHGYLTGKNGDDDNDSYDDSYAFQERFNAYMHELMGSRDIYVCPICYCYKYNALAGVALSDHNVCDIVTSRSFEYDPMSVLIDRVSDDHDNFHFASTFCFRLLKEVKYHITNIHNIDLSHIKGNDLFKGYQIRAPDGLLQRWLKIRFPRTIDAQDMRRYWADGYHRLDYLELAFLVDHDQSLSRTDHRFYESFQDQALTLWEMISGAFERLENDDLDDFIVAEGLESDASCESGPRNINLYKEESDPEVEFVKRLRARRAVGSSSSSTHSEQHSSEESVEIGQNEELHMDSDDDSDYSSEPNEEDEWLSQKLLTPKKKKTASPATSAKITSSGKFSKLRKLNAGSQDSETDEDIEDTPGCYESGGEKKKIIAEQIQYSVTKKKRVVMESEDSE